MSTIPGDNPEGLAPGELPTDRIVVRELEERDLERLVRIDRSITRHERRGYYEKKVEAALKETSIRLSLVAEVDGLVVGFLLGVVYHGEYGQLDAFATIDTLGVDPDFRTRGVGHALMEQFLRNLAALRIDTVRTEVDWDQWPLMTFLRSVGFKPAARLCLERMP